MASNIPVIVQGNSFSLAIPLQIYYINGDQMDLQDYYPDPTDEVSIQLKGSRRNYTYTPTIDGNVANIDLGGYELADNYSVVVSIVKANGQRLRSFRTDQFFIVESSDDLTPADIIQGLEENVIYLNASIFIAGADGRGITSIVKTATAGLVDTYTITYSDNTTSTYNVTNGAQGEAGADGVGITSIEKTSTAGLVDTYTITMSNGTTTTFEVTNGKDGVDLGLANIVNDLTTGGATNVLSAEQGKILNDNAQVVEQIDTNQRVDLGYLAGSANVYATHATYKGFFVPVKAGERYKITASPVATIYTVVTNNDIGNNLSIPYATGWSRITLLANSTADFTIPSNGTHIWVQSLLGGGVCVPAIVLLEPVADVAENNEDNIGENNFGTWTLADLSNKVVYNDFIVGGSLYPDKWFGNYPNRNVAIVPIPSGAKYMRVVTSLDAGVSLFLLQNNKAPANDTQADCAEAYADGRIVLNPKTDTILPLYDDCRYFAYNLSAARTIKPSGSVPITLATKFYFATEPTSVADKFTPTNLIAGGQIGEVQFNTAPTLCISNTTGTAVDDGYIGCVSVVKISEQMYYMYYNCCPSGGIADNAMKLAFAYSTDGDTWVRGFPAGITPPVSGSNLLSNEHHFQSQVVKVCDSEYPFRMVSSKWHNSINMYRSADGISWELIRTYPRYYDSCPTLIVRGDVIKIYMRRRDVDTKQIRYIGVATVDLNGNLIGQPTIFFGKYLYNGGGSRLDDRREILFPTYFNADDSEAHLTCFVVDGDKITPQEVDFSNIITANDKWMEAYGLVNIGESMYLFMRLSNGLHNDPYPKKSDIVKAKVTFVRTGLDGAYW